MARPTIDDIFEMYWLTMESEFRRIAYHTYQSFLILKMAALVYRAGGKVGGFNPTYGICLNVRGYVNPLLGFKAYFPVPGGVMACMRNKDKWKGAYGDARMKFLDDCLYALEEYLKL